MSVAERIVRRYGTRAQYAFALEARPCCRPAASPCSPRPMKARLQDVRDAYGTGIEIPVRAARRAKLLFAVRIGLQRQDLPAVRAALVRRGANPSEEYAGLHYCVLRFEAPLALLIGLPGELAALSGATATHMIQPVPDSPVNRKTQHAHPDRCQDRPRASQPAR